MSLIRARPDVTLVTMTPTRPAQVLEGSWSSSAAHRHRITHGLGLIEAAARACEVYAGRWAGGATVRAVRVELGGSPAHGGTTWLVFPVNGGWLAARPEGSSTGPGPDGALWMLRRDGERHVPTAAWGAFLAATAGAG